MTQGGHGHVLRREDEFGPGRLVPFAGAGALGQDS